MKIEGLKPWHIVLFVVAVGGLIAGIFMSSSGNTPDMAKRILMVDLASGELFEVDTSDKGVILPARNPDTNRATLMPAQKEPDGTWRVHPMYYRKELRTEMEGPLDALVNVETGQVKVTSESTRKIKP